MLLEAVTGCCARPRLRQLSLCSFQPRLEPPHPSKQALSPSSALQGRDLAGSSAVPLNPPCAIGFRILRRLLLSRRIASTRLPFAISGTGSNPPSQWHCNGEPVLKSGAWRQRTVELANTTLAILNSAASHEPHVQKTRHKYARVAPEVLPRSSFTMNGTCQETTTKTLGAHDERNALLS